MNNTLKFTYNEHELWIDGELKEDRNSDTLYRLVVVYNTNDTVTTPVDMRVTYGMLQEILQMAVLRGSEIAQANDGCQ